MCHKVLPQHFFYETKTSIHLAVLKRKLTLVYPPITLLLCHLIGLGQGRGMSHWGTDASPERGLGLFASSTIPHVAWANIRAKTHPHSTRPLPKSNRSQSFRGSGDYKAIKCVRVCVCVNKQMRGTGSVTQVPIQRYFALEC